MNCKTGLTIQKSIAASFSLINANPLSNTQNQGIFVFGAPMTKFAQLAISLPLVVLPVLMLAGHPARSETVGLERALELLAKSTVVDAKCHVLSPAERDELSRYVSRAEVVAAQKTSLGQTQSSLSAGRKMGQAAACSTAASAEVRDTLSAARDAIKTAANVQNREMPPAQAHRGQPTATATLSDYGQVTEAYFLERRCTFLSSRQIAIFYRAVLKNHYAAIATYGKPAISVARRDAEQRANAQSCNSAGRAKVNQSFAEVASR